VIIENQILTWSLVRILRSWLKIIFNMTKHMKIFLSFLITLTIFNSSYGQANEFQQGKISPILLKQDFMMLRDSLQKFHAGLYRYKNKTEICSMFDSCYSTLNDSMTTIEYFKLISFVIGSIEDGHTECFPPSDVVKYFKENAKLFPMQLRFINDKAFVPCNTEEFPEGTEIIKIDNKQINEIKKELCLYLSSDGNNQTGKYAKLNYGHDPFFYMYYVVFGSKHSFKVEYKTKEGKLEIDSIDAINFKKIECLPAQVKIEKYLQLEFKPDKIAILTLKTFSDERLNVTKEDFKLFLDSSFKEIKNKKVEKLIVDIRENTGGDDVNGALLYTYLTDKPFKYYHSLTSNTHVYKADEYPNLGVQKPNENNYKGETYFLISGKSFSGSAEFSSIAKSNARGKFIGEETGGGYYGNTSGSKIVIILTNSKIQVNIPLRKYVMAVKKTHYTDRGIMPDYTIVPTINDILTNKDVQLNFALKLAIKK